MIKIVHLLLFLLLIPVLAHTEKPLIMSVGGKWPPYHYITPEGINGIDIVLTKEIIAQAKLQLQVKLIPALRGQNYLKSGNVDILSGASYNQERSEYANFSTSYRTEEVVLFVRKGSSELWPMNKLIDIKDYPSLQLAAARGGWYGTQYQEVIDDPVASQQLSLSTSIDARLKMLARSRIDMVIDDKYALIWSAKSLGLQDLFEIHPLKLSSEPIYLMLSKISVPAEIVKRINNAIENLKKNGTLKRVLQTHLDSITVSLKND